MKKAVSLALLIVLCFGLVGCGNGGQPQSNPTSPTSGSSSNAEKKDLVVSEIGFSPKEYGGVNYAAIIENPNNEWLAEGIQVVVTGKDIDGKILFSNTDTISYLFANGKTAISGIGSADGVSTIEAVVTVGTSGWSKETTQAGDADKLFEVTNLNEVVGQYGSVSYTGEVKNGLDEQVGALQVTVVLRDADGAIVGGHYTYVSSIPSNGSLPFDIAAYDVPEHATFEAYSDHAF